MKKKLLFASETLMIGGIEKALINMLNALDKDKYDITILLQNKTGEFLDKVPKWVTIKEYKISRCKIIFFRKIINRMKLWLYTILNYKKYDFAACYATYSIPSALLSIKLGKKSAFWVHADYYYVYNKEEKAIKKYFEERKIFYFNKIIFVANESKNNFVKIYPDLKERLLTINNILDYEQVYSLSKETVNQKKDNKTIFLNVSRHEENQKRITRLINAVEDLKTKTTNFKVLLIGDGPDHQFYKNLVKEKSLNDHIIFKGSLKNPYPYYKIANAFVLTSHYEGFPVVFTESLLFNLPIISTINVSDNYIDIKKMGNVIVEKDPLNISLEMLQIVNGNHPKYNFDPELYNNNLIKDLETLINTI